MMCFEFTKKDCRFGNASRMQLDRLQYYFFASLPAPTGHWSIWMPFGPSIAFDSPHDELQLPSRLACIFRGNPVTGSRPISWVERLLSKLIMHGNIAPVWFSWWWCHSGSSFFSLNNASNRLWWHHKAQYSVSVLENIWLIQPRSHQVLGGSKHCVANRNSPIKWFKQSAWNLRLHASWNMDDYLFVYQRSWKVYYLCEGTFVTL